MGKRKGKSHADNANKTQGLLKGPKALQFSLMAESRTFSLSPRETVIQTAFIQART